ncbi:MAG: DNA polymerase [Gemmatimonadales bacterium]|nr:DNA polymerase [Gemmatimonadales bacterium]
MREVPADGPIPARIMIVGEAPGADEESQGRPFVGSSGKELDRMLHEAGITRSECFVTNVCRVRPPRNDISLYFAKAKKDRTLDHVQVRGKWVLPPIQEGLEKLKIEVGMVKPNLIIALGSTALWALTGIDGVMKWRGSMLHCDFAPDVKVIPTVHPAAVLRQWELRALAVHDLKRAAPFRDGRPYPKKRWETVVRPSFEKAYNVLRGLFELANQIPEFEISFDLETRHGHIACAGLSWHIDGKSLHNQAISIPFMCVENREGYWAADEEGILVYWIYRLLTHPQVRVVGQNLLYDSQYTYRHWHFIPRVAQDTMISHHVTFLGLPKNLGFQASMYCDHYVYWKDDGKTWDRKMGEDQLWAYNGEDCARTHECAVVERANIAKFGLQDQEAFVQSMFWPVLKAMIRGVRIDEKRRGEMSLELMEAMGEREAYFQHVLGHPLNPRSSPQMQKLFYQDLMLPVQRSRKTGMPTLDDKALDKLAAKEPLIRPLLKAIQEYRSLGVFLGTFVKAPLDIDKRMRCSYNICGTETLRLASSENAFGSGTNLQNLPKGHIAKEPEDLSLPNVRKMFIPDPGFTFFDMDLDRADLQVVVWEADDADMKRALRMGIDMHLMNACDIFRIRGVPYDELVEGHPNYKEHRARIGEDNRQKAKQGCHAVNYFCQARTLAMHLGCSVAEAQRFIDTWLGARPGIKKWHLRTAQSLERYRMVQNAFGYRRYYFDRVDGLLPEALAWQPQSTVALTINKIWLRLDREWPGEGPGGEGANVQVNLQVHDSLAGQLRTALKSVLLPRIAELSRVEIPYPDPLIIPAGIKLSETSWGDVK